MEIGKATGSTSLLSKKVNIVGEIQGNEDLHVEGRFKGSIKISGNIFVSQTGVVEADIEADNIVIQGKITAIFWHASSLKSNLTDSSSVTALRNPLISRRVPFSRAAPICSNRLHHQPVQPCPELKCRRNKSNWLVS